MSERKAVMGTALGPMVIAACDRHLPAGHRITDDGLALRLLPAPARVAVRLPFVRRFLAWGADRWVPGLWAAVLCRKRYADEQVRAALESGIDQVVVLGAGLDTRACRLAVPKARAYELDLAANIARKHARLSDVFGRLPDGLTLVPVDFDRDDLAAALADDGFRIERPAMFVWEAVTQYLTEDGVHATLSALSGAAPGSRLIFTYLLQDFLEGTQLYGGGRMYRRFVAKQRIFRFGLHPGDVAGLLAPYGWIEREQVGTDDYLERYVRPAGREGGLAAPTPVERFVYAEKS